MFEEFDFSILDDPEFKEDSVREEIVSPLLRKLGYSATGDSRIIRSKALTHPFVHIGTVQRKINIVPDYLLQVDGKSVLVLDAKGPRENILKGKNVDQAFSYAIHHEVRAFLYGLCNGREIVIFQVTRLDPILHIPIIELNERWGELYRIISPLALTKPHVLDFHPDFGLSMLRYGAIPDIIFNFVGAWVNFISRVSDEQYTIVSIVRIGEDKFAASFDFDQSLLSQFMSCVPERAKNQISRGISHQPYFVRFSKEESFEVLIEAHFSDKILCNENEQYLPLIVDKFDKLPYDQ